MQPLEESILRSLRRIGHAVDVHSRRLRALCQLTTPQLICVRELAAEGELTASEVARRMMVSQATASGVLDRLEERGLLTRQRSAVDRRRVILQLTEAGKKVAATAPPPLQARFLEELARRSERWQITIDLALQEVVQMMEAEEIDAAPLLDPDRSLG